MQRSAYLIIVVTLFVCLAAYSTVHAVEYPYNAYVTAGESFAMSGPGMVGEYRTERLERGQRVTVYQQVPGWCAIRPTHGAHSWIDGRYLDQVAADSARVKIAKVPSFIGSSLQARRDKYQVTLDAGELVQVVEVTETSAGTWYKIAPPAGEFRWVSSAELGRDPTEDTTHNVAASGPITTSPITTAANDPPPSFPGGNVANAAAADPALNAPGQISQWQTADSSRWRNLHPGTIVSTSGTGQVIAQAPPTAPATVPVEPKNWSTAANPPAATTTPIAASNIPLGGPASAATAADGTMSRSVQNELEAIEYDLSAMMAQDPSAWNFATFNQRSEILLDKASSPYERGKVRMLQVKLARFADIKQRTLDQQSLLATTPARDKVPTHAVVATTTPAGSPFALPKTSTDWVPGARPNANSLIATQGLGTGGLLKAPATINDPVMGRYDAIGTLARVNSSRANSPKYALIEGKTVLAFVTPGPGVELDAYIHKQIGIIGQKGYMPELKASHITATTIGPTDPATIARMRADQKFR
jgi:hypothetical protein